MKDDLPYFSHDNDSRNHPKMKALRARFGWTGYGQFWALNEMIAGSSCARLDLSRKVVRAATACELGMTTDALDDFLKFLSDRDECGLIHYEDGIVTTDRTSEDYSRVESERERKRDNGRTSAEKRQSSAEKQGNSAEKVNRIEENREEKNREIEREDARAESFNTFDQFLQFFISAWNDAGCTPRFSPVIAMNLTTDERDKFGKASARLTDVPRAVKAIQNYAAIQKSPEHEVSGNYKLPGFLIGGIDDYADDADPFERFKKKVPESKFPEKMGPLDDRPDAWTAEDARKLAEEAGRERESRSSDIFDEWAGRNAESPLAKILAQRKNEPCAAEQSAL